MVVKPASEPVFGEGELEGAMGVAGQFHVSRIILNDKIECVCEAGD